MRSSLRRRSPHEISLELAVVDAFRRAGWRVIRPHQGDAIPDLVVHHGAHRYVIEVKSAVEARRDRIVPLLAQAILEARAAAKADASCGSMPLAIVGAPYISNSIQNELQSFAAHVAPDVAIGIFDADGSRLFVGQGLEPLNLRLKRPKKMIHVPSLRRSVDLFSDLNQWILKVLLAPGIPEPLLRAPRGQFGSVPALARGAGVSLMSAFRCVSLLKANGFIDENSSILRLNRVDELLNRWQSASIKPAPELPMRWLIPGDAQRQLPEAMRAYEQYRQSSGRVSSRRPRHPAVSPRICLALFAAAEALGFGFVRGVAPHVYLERFDPQAIERLGLAPARPGQNVDVFVRIPSLRQAIFRAAVEFDGLPVCDIVQVWLDVARHPSRGSAQAREIWQRVLAPLARKAARDGD